MMALSTAVLVANLPVVSGAAQMASMAALMVKSLLEASSAALASAHRLWNRSRRGFTFA